MNGPNTHGALLDLGNGVRAFVDGIPDSCLHVWNGPGYFVTASGRLITITTFPPWSSYTTDVRDDLILFHQELVGDPVIESGCTCSKCHKLFTPDFFG